MVLRRVRWRAGASRILLVKSGRRCPNRVSSTFGGKSFMRAAASSIASGKPSRRAQISATAGALVFVTWKSGWTACARSMKIATASYCDSVARFGRCLGSGSASAGTGNSCSARTCSASRLVTSTLSLGQAPSKSAICVAALATCSKLSSTDTHPHK